MQSALVGLLGGLLTSVQGLRPTSSPPISVVLVTLAVAGATTLGARAPRSVILAVALLSTALTGSWWSIPIGAAAVALVAPPRSAPLLAGWRPAIASAATCYNLAHLRSLGAFGVSTAVAVLIVVSWLALATVRLNSEERRWLRLGVVAGGGVTVVVLLTFAVSALAARSNLTRGAREARAALKLIDQGDIDAAIALFDQSAAHLQSASGTLSAWWAAPSRAVPLVAQHRDAAVSLAKGASGITSEIRDILRATDYDSLKVTNGQIDLDAIRALSRPLGDLETALGQLQSLTSGERNPWLLPTVRGWLDELDRDAAKRQQQLDDIQEAIRVAPDMLGARGPRVYFVALTTPAEARGVGGLMGNWAEVTADQGRLTLSGFGRDRDLLLNAPSTPRLTGLDPEFLALYGQYVIADPATGSIGPGAWQNATAAPHFPWVAEVLANLYPQSGGKQVDGVFLMDVYAISTLMQITGSVAVPSLGVDISPENALQYLLRDQYLVEDLDSRVDLLETLARTTIDRVLAGSLPTPPKLAALMSPMARQHRLIGWARRPAEQQVLANANLSKELGAEDDWDLLSYTIYNGNGNKIDSYLEGTAAYDLSIDRQSRAATGTMTLTFRNAAPASGLPDYVIGNLVGLPRGTNRLILTLYSTLEFDSVASDDVEVSWSPGSERGLYTAAMELVIPPGATVTVVAGIGGTARPDTDYRIAVDQPPIAHPFETTLAINGKSLTPIPLTESGTFRLNA